MRLITFEIWPPMMSCSRWQLRLLLAYQTLFLLDKENCGNWIGYDCSEQPGNVSTKIKEPWTGSPRCRKSVILLWYWSSTLGRTRILVIVFPARRELQYPKEELLVSSTRIRPWINVFLIIRISERGRHSCIFAWLTERTQLKNFEVVLQLKGLFFARDARACRQNRLGHNFLLACLHPCNYILSMIFPQI